MEISLVRRRLAETIERAKKQAADRRGRGESGPRARPSDPEWFRSLRTQCAAARVPLFFKQWGEHGEDMRKVGRRLAGRLLDGNDYREAPTVRP